jgi:hypothetical protein
VKYRHLHSLPSDGWRRRRTGLRCLWTSKLAATFQTTTTKVFFDDYSIPAGGKFDECCTHGVENSNIFVAIISTRER